MELFVQLHHQGHKGDISGAAGQAQSTNHVIQLQARIVADNAGGGWCFLLQSSASAPVKFCIIRKVLTSEGCRLQGDLSEF